MTKLIKFLELEKTRIAGHNQRLLPTASKSE